MLNNNAFILSLLSMMPMLAIGAGLEEVPASEAATTMHIVQLVEESIRHGVKTGLALRGAHAKAHGCVTANFRILDNLPNELRVGIFSNARSYTSWIRFSNGSGKIQDDSVGDARGMAVKLQGIGRDELSGQDFIMINHPVFLVRNAADYVEFHQALMHDRPSEFFFSGWNPLNFRWHELGIANAIKSTKMENPLNSEYWSMTPYRFGATAMKFSARPCGKLSDYIATSATDFLADNLQKHLTNSGACFDFLVQLRQESTAMPIEDPTIEWSAIDSPFIPVAKIEIPAQAFASGAQKLLCEKLVFSPWNSVPEHQPLGGINRVRKAVYETSARVRHQLNKDELIRPSFL